LKARPQVKKRKKDFANSYCDHLQNAVKGCDKGRNVVALWWQISKAERYQLWERCLPAMNDNAECLPNRGVSIAGKHRSHFNRVSLLERGLPAKNDKAVCLTNRANIAGKPRSNGRCDFLWERCLPAKNAKAECLPKRVANIAGKRAPTGSVMVCACQTEAPDSRASTAPTGDQV